MLGTARRLAGAALAGASLAAGSYSVRAEEGEFATTAIPCVAMCFERRGSEVTALFIAVARTELL